MQIFLAMLQSCKLETRCLKQSELIHCLQWAVLGQRREKRDLGSENNAGWQAITAVQGIPEAEVDTLKE